MLATIPGDAPPSASLSSALVSVTPVPFEALAPAAPLRSIPSSGGDVDHDRSQPGPQSPPQSLRRPRKRLVHGGHFTLACENGMLQVLDGLTGQRDQPQPPPPPPQEGDAASAHDDDGDVSAETQGDLDWPGLTIRHLKVFPSSDPVKSHAWSSDGLVLVTLHRRQLCLFRRHPHSKAPASREAPDRASGSPEGVGQGPTTPTRHTQAPGAAQVGGRAAEGLRFWHKWVLPNENRAVSIGTVKVHLQDTKGATADPVAQGKHGSGGNAGVNKGGGTKGKQGARDEGRKEEGGEEACYVIAVAGSAGVVLYLMPRPASGTSTADGTDGGGDSTGRDGRDGRHSGEAGITGIMGTLARRPPLVLLQAFAMAHVTFSHPPRPLLRTRTTRTHGTQSQITSQPGAAAGLEGRGEATEDAGSTRRVENMGGSGQEGLVEGVSITSPGTTLLAIAALDGQIVRCELCPLFSPFLALILLSYSVLSSSITRSNTHSF